MTWRWFVDEETGMNLCGICLAFGIKFWEWIEVAIAYE